MTSKCRARGAGERGRALLPAAPTWSLPAAAAGGARGGGALRGPTQRLCARGPDGRGCRGLQKPAALPHFSDSGPRAPSPPRLGGCSVCGLWSPPRPEGRCALAAPWSGIWWPGNWWPGNRSWSGVGSGAVARANPSTHSRVLGAQGELPTSSLENNQGSQAGRAHRASGLARPL